MKPDSFLMSFRVQCLLGFFVCVGLMSYAYYVQFGAGIEPCPLCILQRIAVISIGIFLLIGAIHGPHARGRKVYAVLVLLSAAAGAGVAGYNLWLQHQPPDPMASCAPGFSYMIENFPISKAIKMAFTGHADCSQVSWTILGLSMPFWTLLAFVVIGIVAIWAGFRNTGRQRA